MLLETPGNATPQWRVGNRGSRLAAGGSGPRPLPLSVSLAAHALVLALVMVPPDASFPKKQTAYDQMIAGREQKLVWYKFRDKLPDVKPLEKTADKRPPRAEVKIAKQSIVSAPKNAPHAFQMVWQPVPELKVKEEVKSPNILALAMPKIQPPKIERPAKQFEPPRPVRHAPNAKPVDLPPAPEVKMASSAAKTADTLRKLEQALNVKPSFRTFDAPPPKPKAPPKEVAVVLPDAPLLPTNNVNSGLPHSLGALPKVAKPFTPPSAQTRAPNATASVEIPGVPGLATAGVMASNEALNQLLAKSVSPNQMNAAVIGLNPADKLKPLPNGSRPAEFSAGPELNPNGGTGAKDGSRISIPDLSVRGSAPVDTRATLMARNTPPNPPADLLKESSKYLTVHDIGRGSGARVSGSPDPRFEGRQVFTTAIQMANITSYAGSWLMWYAGRDPVPLNSGIITPPVPRRKVDPKYIAAAVDERVEGTVRLACVIQRDGRVSAVEVVKGLDDRLDRSATEALLKWEFGPAMRNSSPVDVDVLVEIPFHLAPHVEK